MTSFPGLTLHRRLLATLLSFSVLGCCASAPAQQPDSGKPLHLPRGFRPDYGERNGGSLGSTYIPLDSWMYPALVRLQALGYLNTGFLGLRPWTRLSTLHMLESTGEQLLLDAGPGRDEAEDLYLALANELSPDADFGGGHAELDTVYTRFLGIANTPLNDSYHLGQTIINDYGRPYQAGLMNSSGISGRAEYGRYTLYTRGEYQRAPSAAGYPFALGAYLSDSIDNIPIATNPVQATLPIGPIAGVDHLRLLEATVSAHFLGHELSLGKTDHLWGPGQGGAFAWSNNADNLYAFQIDRVEPLHVPILSWLTGPFRYEFFVGSLQGHTDPNHPWVHAEKVSFKPSRNLEFGFERTVIWGGRGHEPVTVGTFIHSFVSVTNVSNTEKFSTRDPGARFSAFDFSYRLPLLRNWITLYTDSFAHDDINPVDAPRRAGIRPGIYLSHLPAVPRLDLRVEAATTDPPTSRSFQGSFLDQEAVQLQGTTNKGLLFGDAIGREDKGGQAWATYHLSPREQIQVSYRNVKAAKDFIPYGTTQNAFEGELVKRLGQDVELKAWVQYERWKAPFYQPGLHSDVSAAGQLTVYPHKEKIF